MRGILIAIFMMTASFGLAGEAVTPEGIKAIKEKIASHEQIAKQADRRAQRLLSQDFSSYRRYIDIRDRNLAMIPSGKLKHPEFYDLS
jgi:hypothetical protein